MKRICTCLLAAALVVGAFTGCAAKPAAGTDTTTKQETTTETTTVTTTVDSVAPMSPKLLTNSTVLYLYHLSGAPPQRRQRVQP